MKNRRLTIYKLRVTLLFLSGIFFLSCNLDKETILDSQGEERTIIGDDLLADNPGENTEIAIKSPPFSEDIFPCSECHIDLEPNLVKRKLESMHEDISAMFTHDEENRWCLDCHEVNNRDSLRLASGKLIGFDESYKLCGQCHGDKLRDWKVGVHGKRTGSWSGTKQYLLCVHCHNPHSPHFVQLKPLPPPQRQEDIHL